ncbi:TlpA disulfide reductase family protein [Corynebacterium tuscaniense]|uniref:TlpA disulfide reductase family protein n=1 Tax=Corynebacterium tuscaniense TaxID=302449 RepID=UPI00123B3425|nr:TlpA disulfide reductase family protein [Corynebacterium tuscaniense]KAA8743875.1 TlpA family protein disulfide reductase [Corynebacterium tuscaniense]
MRRFHAMVLSGVALLGAFGLSACAVPGSSETFAFHSPGGQVEIFYDEADRAPLSEFSGESLMEPGTQISLSDFEDQMVVLNAWGQWCAPCRAEVDDLQEVQEHLTGRTVDGKPSGTILGINVRDYQPEISRDFLTDNGATYPSIYDPPFRTAAALGGIPTSVIPTTVILDKQHRPAAVFLREVTASEIIEVTDRLEGEN